MNRFDWTGVVAPAVKAEVLAPFVRAIRVVLVRQVLTLELLLQECHMSGWSLNRTARQGFDLYYSRRLSLMVYFLLLLE